VLFSFSSLLAVHYRHNLIDLLKFYLTVPSLLLDSLLGCFANCLIRPVLETHSKVLGAHSRRGCQHISGLLNRGIDTLRCVGSFPLELS
jgi:hypothetical protein